MKLTSLILGLPLAVSALAVEKRDVEVAEARQAGAPLEKVSPVMRKDSQRKFFTVATFNLKANPNPAGAAAKGGRTGGMSMGGMGGMMGEGDTQTWTPRISGSQFCGDCYVLMGQIKLTYADGTFANISNGVYVHHVLTNGMSMGSFVSGIAQVPIGSGFVGAGDDNGNTPFIYTSRDSSVESGFKISPMDSFTAQTVLVNYNQQPKTVYMHYDLEYYPTSVAKTKNVHPVTSMLLSPSGVGNPRASKSGATNTTNTMPMTFTKNGYIISAKGHLHDGGTAMYMSIAKASGGTYFQCASRATYGGKIYGTDLPTISDMNECNTAPVKVEKGMRLTMTAEYDLKKHPLRGTSNGGEAGTMGMFRTIFAETA